jgi:hemerythrin
MQTIEFQDVDALGIEIIDAQHRRYFELLNDLLAARAAGRGNEAVLDAVTAMVDYVDKHFATEERYMREFGYTDFAAHRELHAGFVRKVIALNRALRRGDDHLDDDLVAYLGEWFQTHIRQEDPKFVPLLKANGLT